MIEVSFYDMAGNLVARSVYDGYRTAFRMAEWLRRIMPGATVSVRNLAKAR